MRTLMKCMFGSRVYGTSVPTSDHDYKAIFVPDPADILLQKAPRVISDTTKKDPLQKNTSEDTDLEMFSLHEFFRLLQEGQTVCVDILFTPPQFFLEFDKNVWPLIYKVGVRQLSNKVSSFAGYCRVQANKYGIKGSRVAAVREAVGILNKFGDHDPLEIAVPRFEELAKTSEHVKIVNLPTKDKVDCWHVEVCNRKMPFKVIIKFARDCYQKILDEYGQRALQAEKNEGVDWKALMHAVRVAQEAKELLLTGRIIFPRPEAPTLLKIRKGELPYQEVAEMIEKGLVDLEEAQAASVLPSEPDFELAKNLICRVYGEEIFLAPELKEIIENKMLKHFVIGY